VASPPAATPVPTGTPGQPLDLEPVALAAAALGGQVDDVGASVDWHAFVPTDEADHLATMDRAARESNCGVPWQLLAAIARVESDFGRNMSTSTAGAIGYGQFLPSSWRAFGSEGNAYDYRDALPAIALYLCQAGLERDPRTALFAYNHADWYVDMVLDLAVQYDRMAPGAPIPAVLNVGPAQQQPAAMAYASGRDLRQQTRARKLDDAVTWLGVPWRGRPPGQAIGAASLEGSALSMVRQAYGLRGDVAPPKVAAGSEDLRPIAAAAWDNGLLAAPAPVQAWTLADLRLRVARGQPVVVYVGNRGLPGHPSDEDGAEQPLVLIGTTPTGFVYSDPTFSSSLGYGLELADADLQRFWDAAVRPRQAVAFVMRPEPLPRQAHVAEAEAPEPLARVTATPTPLPTATPVPTAVPVVIVAPTATATAVPVVVAAETPSPSPVDHTREWFAAIGVGLGALVLGAVAVRRLLARAAR